MWILSQFLVEEPSGDVLPVFCKANDLVIILGSLVEVALEGKGKKEKGYIRQG